MGYGWQATNFHRAQARAEKRVPRRSVSEGGPVKTFDGQNQKI
jgi:hypothetical protein